MVSVMLYHRLTARGLFALVSFFTSLLILPAWASAAPLNFNDFYADSSVTVSADGFSAILEEDPALGVVLLANDPGKGDPAVLNSGLGLVLKFDYEFDLGANNEDEFSAFLLDTSSGDPISGGLYEFFTQSSGSGTITFNLTSLVATYPVLGLQIQLSALPGDSLLDSQLRVSNLRIEAAEIVEPTSVLLLAGGVFGLRRRRAVRSGLV